MPQLNKYKFFNCSDGIQIGFSSNITIMNNDVSYNYGDGIYLLKSNGNSILKNTVSCEVDMTDTSPYSGIYLRGSSDNSVSDNLCTKNVNGILLGGDDNIIFNNSCNDNNVGIYAFGENNITNNTSNSNGEYGIKIEGDSYHSSTHHVSNNTCNFNEGGGIEVWRSNENVIEHNNCSSNSWTGISLHISNDNQIKANTFINNTAGISLDSSKRNSLKNNIMKGCGIEFYEQFYSIDCWNTHDIDKSNFVNGNPVIYWKNRTGGTISLGAGQVILANCTNVTIRDQNITNCTNGIQIGFSSDNLLMNNTCNYNFNGIFLFSSNRNIIRNNTLSNNRYCGIYSFYGADENKLWNNTMESNTHGISFGGWSQNPFKQFEISNNYCVNNSVGIDISYSKEFIITNNSCINNRDSGINLYRSNSMEINDNVFANSGIEIGGNLYDWSTHNISISNIINGKPIYYWKNITGGTVPTNGGQVILANCTDVFIEKQNISNSSTAILLGHSSQITIENNNCSRNIFGMRISDSPNNFISNNSVESNEASGILLESGTNNNIVTKNSAYFNGEYGIYCRYEAKHNIIDNNICISNHWSGIASSGEGTSIHNNVCSDNIWVGIVVGSGGHSNSILNNHIINNTWFGVIIASYASENNIYHNNLISNNKGGLQALDNGTDNHWNTNTRGNYWSDWNGTDTNNDGITDDPYPISGTSESYDYYPLLNPIDFTLPIAHGGFPVSVDKNTRIQFDATRSFDDHGIINFTWSFFYNGNHVELYGITPNFTFEVTGFYEIQLLVTDSDGNVGIDSVVVTIRPDVSKDDNDDMSKKDLPSSPKIKIWFAIIGLIFIVIIVCIVVIKNKGEKDGGT